MTTIVQKDNRNGREQTTLLITYATATMQHQGRVPKPPEDLLTLLRAVADPTRMQILRLLAQRPCSTREIAKLIGLTEAAISKHLKLLHEAGWVSTERQSYYVYYRLTRDSLVDLMAGLNHLLA